MPRNRDARRPRIQRFPTRYAEVRPGRKTMMPTLFAQVAIALALTGQAPAAEVGVAASPAERLEFMKESARGYEMTGSGAGVLKLQADPVFRLGKQGVGEVVDGAILLWTDETGRPTAALQAFLIKTTNEPGGLWVHEFTSLATGPITATRLGRAAWSPARPGLEFRPLPDAPKPGDTPAQRQRQMRQLADGFKATDDFGKRGWSALRLLPKPIARYGKPGGEAIDGAMFALVLGTDPETFLFLEARNGRNGLQWHYALAPMTVYALNVSYQDKPIWSAPNREPANDPSRPFYDTTYHP